MPTVIPVLKGTLGTTEYFVCAMKAGELAEKARIPAEDPDWKNPTYEEQEQRKINYARVKRQIAPYLAQDKDRFFGAIIVAVKNFDPVKSFEPITDMVKGMPNIYKSQAGAMGFLTLSGGRCCTLSTGSTA